MKGLFFNGFTPGVGTYFGCHRRRPIPTMRSSTPCASAPWERCLRCHENRAAAGLVVGSFPLYTQFVRLKSQLSVSRSFCYEWLARARKSEGLSYWTILCLNRKHGTTVFIQKFLYRCWVLITVCLGSSYVQVSQVTWMFSAVYIKFSNAITSEAGLSRPSQQVAACPRRFCWLQAAEMFSITPKTFAKKTTCRLWMGHLATAEATVKLQISTHFLFSHKKRDIRRGICFLSIWEWLCRSISSHNITHWVSPKYLSACTTRR